MAIYHIISLEQPHLDIWVFLSKVQGSDTPGPNFLRTKILEFYFSKT